MGVGIIAVLISLLSASQYFHACVLERLREIAFIVYRKTHPSDCELMLIAEILRLILSGLNLFQYMTTQFRFTLRQCQLTKPEQ